MADAESAIRKLVGKGEATVPELSQKRREHAQRQHEAVFINVRKTTGGGYALDRGGQTWLLTEQEFEALTMAVYSIRRGIP